MKGWCRTLHVLVADPEFACVLVGDDGALPTVSVQQGGDERRAMLVGQTLRQRWGVDVALLELHGDDERGEPGRPVLAVVELLDAPAILAHDVHWHPLDGEQPPTDPSLQPRAEQWWSEWRGDVPRAEPRPGWARPGWYRLVSEWIDARLAERGRSRTGPIEQFRHWEISAVLRIPTDAGPLWFKEVFAVFAHEPAVTDLLAREAPGLVPDVLAAEPASGWLLLGDLGAVTVADRPDADAAAIQRLVRCQRAFVDRAEELRTLGCAVRPFAGLAASLADVFADPAARAYIDVSDDRAATIVHSVAVNVAAVDGLGFPATLVHGDFHPENVMVADDGPVILDWSDAAVANPLVDALTWWGWLGDAHRERGERGWRAFLQEWSDVCSIERAEAVRGELEGLAAAYHVVSYAGIVTALEPLQRADLGGGLTYYFGLLDRAVPAASGEGAPDLRRPAASAAPNEAG